MGDKGREAPKTEVEGAQALVLYCGSKINCLDPNFACLDHKEA